MVTTYFFYIQKRNHIEHHFCKILIAFFWMQFAQTIFCIFIDFVQIYELRTRGTPDYDNAWLRWWAELKEKIRPLRNAVVPKIQFAMYYLLVILLPLAIIVIFGCASMFTDLWDTTIAPWLLACVVNNLILATYTNYALFMPIVDEALYEVHVETIYEESYNKAVSLGFEFVADLGQSKPSIEEKLLSGKNIEDEG